MRLRKSSSDPGRRRHLRRRAAGVFVLVALATLLLAAQPQSGSNRPEQLDKPYIILVSLDGFRADYLDRFNLTSLKRIMRRGVRARSMIPVFPSLTFPNHYSLVTGLFPDRHGIVNNSFYDPERRAKYAMNDKATVLDGTWYGGEPIWVTAETQGMVSACFFWPGSEAAIKGVRPTFAKPYDGAVPNAERVTGVLEWLKLPAERRPHVVTLYFSEVDEASHRVPTSDRRVYDAARSLDRAIGQLLDGIDALPIKDRVYVLITSDHGMVDTTSGQTISIESLVNLDGVIQTFVGPVTSLHVQDHDSARATQLRDELNARLRNGRAFLRGDLPERYHYSGNARNGDVVVVMDEGWALRRSYDLRGIVRPRWGTHGWDPDLPSMRAVFLAMGPGIRGGRTIGDVRNVDVYPLMTELLGLKSAPGIDGTAGRLRTLLEGASPAPEPRAAELGSELDFLTPIGVRPRRPLENRALTPDAAGAGRR